MMISPTGNPISKHNVHLFLHFRRMFFPATRDNWANQWARQELREFVTALVCAWSLAHQRNACNPVIVLTKEKIQLPEELHNSFRAAVYLHTKEVARMSEMSDVIQSRQTFLSDGGTWFETNKL